MLLDFFYTLRSAKLPVSVKEYLTLLEALQAQIVGPTQAACSMDDFYHLSRMILVKDEKLFDKFDRAFGTYFNGIEELSEVIKEIPSDWLEKTLGLTLTPEQKMRSRRSIGMSF